MCPPLEYAIAAYLVLSGGIIAAMTLGIWAILIIARRLLLSLFGVSVSLVTCARSDEAQGE